MGQAKGKVGISLSWAVGFSVLTILKSFNWWPPLPHAPSTPPLTVVQEPTLSQPAAVPTSVSAAPRVLTTEEIAERTSRSIALIHGHHGSGTAFVVRPGLMATNSHVIGYEREKDLCVSFPDSPGLHLTAQILLEDPRRDLAILEVPTSVSPLEIEPDYRLRKGQEVTVIGNPGFDTVILENAVSRGVMSTDATIKGQYFFQLSIAINAGNSGGPAIDSSGKVIGVVNSKAIQKEGIAFCIPAADLLSGIANAVSGRTDKELVSATHSARYVAARLDKIGTFYLLAIEEAIKRMNSAVAQNLNPTIGIIQVRSEASALLREIDVEWTNELYPELDRIFKDVRISDSVRTWLIEAYKNCQTMRISLDSPEGTPTGYRERAMLLGRQHKLLFELVGMDLQMTSQ